jgi:hypothetical protein
MLAVIRAAKRHKLKQPFALRLSFEKLLSQTDFPGKAKEMLAILEKSYGVPVDVEFAVNFSEQGSWRIHLLQCRPMQVKGGGLCNPSETGSQPGTGGAEIRWTYHRTKPPGHCGLSGLCGASGLCVAA